MAKLKPILDNIVEKIQQPENDPTKNKDNINTRFAKLTSILGRIGENILKAQASRNNPDQFKVFFNGIRNLVERLAVFSIATLYYLDDNFDSKGRPLDKTGETKKD